MASLPSLQREEMEQECAPTVDRTARRNRRRAARHKRLELLSQAASLCVAAADRKEREENKRLNLSNPGPLGLLGYGMTFILVSLHYTGHWPLFAVAEGMSVVFGGGSQIIVGCLAYSRGNTFAYTFAMLSGAFWLSLVAVYALPNNTTGGSPIVSPPTEYFMGVYFLLWSIVSFAMFCCTFFMNLGVMFVHFTHFLWFLLMAIGHMAHKTRCIHAGGYVGLVTGGLSMYVAYAEILNEVFDRTVLPVVPITDLRKRNDKESVRRNIV